MGLGREKGTEHKETEKKNKRKVDGKGKKIK